MVRAKFPDLSAVEVVHRLTATADDKGPLGRDDEYGYGVVNLVKALTADVPAEAPSAVPSHTQASQQTSPSAAPRTDGGFPTRTAIIIGAVLAAVLLAAGAYVIMRRRRST